MVSIHNPNIVCKCMTDWMIGFNVKVFSFQILSFSCWLQFRMDLQYIFNGRIKSLHAKKQFQSALHGSYFITIVVAA